jgi:phosphatidylinositol glycan class C protein
MEREQVKWEKVLWKTQGFEDNCIHPRYFLESLRKNRKFIATPLDSH